MYMITSWCACGCRNWTAELAFAHGMLYFRAVASTCFQWSAPWNQHENEHRQEWSEINPNSSFPTFPTPPRATAWHFSKFHFTQSISHDCTMNTSFRIHHTNLLRCEKLHREIAQLPSRNGNELVAFEISWTKLKVFEYPGANMSQRSTKYQQTVAKHLWILWLSVPCRLVVVHHPWPATGSLCHGKLCDAAQG